MSFIKKIKLFKEYTRILNDNKVSLYLNYNIKIDNAYRMYTVINIPLEYMNDLYSLPENGGNLLSNLYLKRYLNNISKHLNDIGLIELYNIYEFKPVSENSYLLVIGFSLFKSHVFYNILYFIITPILLFLFIILNIILFF